MRKAFSDDLIKNHGDDFASELKKQRTQPKSNLSKLRSSQRSSDGHLVGIVGGGFAGLYAGLILQSLGIEFEVFESSDRVGGVLTLGTLQNTTLKIPIPLVYLEK